MVAAVSLAEGTVLNLLTKGLGLKAHAFKPKPDLYKLHVAPYPPSKPYPPALKPPSHYGEPSTTVTYPPPSSTVPPTTTTLPPPTTTLPPTTTTPVPPPSTTVFEYPPTYGPPHAVYGPPEPSVPKPHETYGVPTEQPPHNAEDCPQTVLQDNLYRLEDTFGENPTSQVVVYPAVPVNSESVDGENYWKTIVNPPSVPVEVEDTTAQDVAVHSVVPSAATDVPVPYSPGLNVPAEEDPNLYVNFNQVGESWGPPPSWAAAVPAEQYGPVYW